MRVAAVQARPAWLDPAATVRLVVDWLERAAMAGVDLVAFPETFLPGYPFWVCRTDGARFEDARQKRAYAHYLEAAVELRGPELAEIVEASGDLGLFAYVGVAERAGGTVYCTVVAIDGGRGIVGSHRKLVPTHDERLVWGFGDGNGLSTHLVHGWRVGGLSCWENWMPLARHALYADGEELHVSLWPGTPALTADITRFVAREGRVYHLAVSGLLDGRDTPAGFEFADELAGIGAVFDGGSAVAGPSGEWVAAPVRGEERLVVVDLDRVAVAAERQSFDPAGHYARPDVFDLRVDRRRRGVAFED
jgi:nitrilase